MKNRGNAILFNGVMGCLAASLCWMAPPPAAADGVEQKMPVKPFIDAAGRGDLDAVDTALKAGIDVNAMFGSRTALHAAAERSQVQVIKRLIESGANVNAENDHRITPIHWASSRGPFEAVQALIQAGADVNIHCLDQHTPLGSAAKAGNLETARALIRAGADVNCRHSLTPLELAARSGRAEMIQLLVEQGADVNDPSHPPLHWSRKPEAVQALLLAGAKVDQRNEKNETALHRTSAHWGPKEESVNLLITAKADVNAKSQSGSTPLHEAVRGRNRDIVRLLIQAGADVHAEDEEGNTPLSLAADADESFLTVLKAAE